MLQARVLPCVLVNFVLYALARPVRVPRINPRMGLGPKSDEKIN